MTSPSRFAAVVASAVLVAACSGSDDDAADTTPPVEGVTTTEAPATSSTAPTTTDAPATSSTAPTSTEDTATSSSAPTTTEAPATSSTVPATTAAGTPEDEVIQTVAFLEAQWEECLRSLPNCDDQVVRDRRTGESARTVQANALRWNRNDYRASNIDALEFRVDDVNVDESAGTAVAMVCVTDPVLLSEADGDTEVDHKFYSSIQEWGLVLVDGAWSLERESVQGEVAVGEDTNVCAA